MMFIIDIIKGIILGCTALIPGISFGTMAIVLDIYDKAILNFTVIVTPKRWNKQTIVPMMRFFLPLLTGVCVAMITLATLISLLLEHYPSFVQLSFVGIILGSIPHIYTHHVKQYISWKIVPYIIIGIVVLLFFAFGDAIFSIPKTKTLINLNINMWTIFTAFIFGIISSACGLLPGISGSFVLLIMGYYPTYLTIMKTLTTALLLPLLIGHIVGLVLAALLIKSLLHRFSAQSYGIIFGLILATVLGIFPWITMPSDIQTLHTKDLLLYITTAVACICFGIILSKITASLSSKK